MIRATNHSFKEANTNKIDTLSLFIQDYKEMANIYLEYLWNNPINYSIKTTTYVFDIKENKLDCPSMLSNVLFDSHLSYESNLSARARKCCLTQVLGAKEIGKGRYIRADAGWRSIQISTQR